jgi:hypothetical protein
MLGRAKLELPMRELSTLGLAMLGLVLLPVGCGPSETDIDAITPNRIETPDDARGPAPDAVRHGQSYRAGVDAFCNDAMAAAEGTPPRERGIVLARYIDTHVVHPKARADWEALLGIADFERRAARAEAIAREAELPRCALAEHWASLGSASDS